MSMIFGRKPVLEAIKAGEEIEQVYIQYGQKGGIIGEIKDAANKEKIKCVEIPIQRFNAMAKKGNTQGVIALLSPVSYYELDELLNSVDDKTDPLFLILDSIQDPMNLGAMLRTAECCGVDGVILTINKSASITETAVKTSAGAVSHLKICKVTNLNNTIKTLKAANFWITGTSLDGDRNYTEVDYSGAVAMIMGNEEKGIHKLVAGNCDFLVKIPMKGHIQSLNVSVTTGVMLFEVLRQRSLKK